MNNIQQRKENPEHRAWRCQVWSNYHYGRMTAERAEQLAGPEPERWIEDDTMKKVGTQVFIYEGGKRLSGIITAIVGNYYKILWSDNTTTMEPINEFNPAGWVAE